MPKKRVPRNVPKVPSHVPRLLPEFDEAFFKQTLTDLRQKLSTQKVQEAEILFQRIVFGLIAPNCKLTEHKYNQYSSTFISQPILILVTILRVYFATRYVF